MKNVITGKPSFVGEAAFEGKLTDAHTGDVVRLSDIWKSETLLMEFGTFT